MSRVLDALLALPAAFLPRRRWQHHPSLPIEQMAALSGALTFVIGVIIGIGGLRDATAELRLHGGDFRFFGASLFLFLTNQAGWVAVYFVVTGAFRAVANWLGDPTGDPVVAAIDALMSRRARAAARRSREQQEGPEVCDRLCTGDWAGLPDVDYVVVASRRKPDWAKGTTIVTSDGWFIVGEPFERRLPQGLRTCYPLIAMKSYEVMRQAVAYHLPPLVAGLRRE